MYVLPTGLGHQGLFGSCPMFVMNIKPLYRSVISILGRRHVNGYSVWCMFHVLAWSIRVYLVPVLCL